MTADELTALFNNMDIDADTSREDIQHFFISSTDESENDIEYYIVISNGVIGGISIENNIYFER